MALSTAVPKPPPRWLHKAQKRADEQKQQRACYAQVDARDGRQCRVCAARVGGIGQLEAAHHHHLQYRSKGGGHTTDNVVTLCVRCHTALHNGEIALSGNADDRAGESGKLCGVKLERATAAGWRVERML